MKDEGNPTDPNLGMVTVPKPPGKAPMDSKTIRINSIILALYPICKAIWPELEIPQDLLVNGMALINLILRFVTTQPLGQN